MIEVVSHHRRHAHNKEKIPFPTPAVYLEGKKIHAPSRRYNHPTKDRPPVRVFTWKKTV